MTCISRPAAATRLFSICTVACGLAGLTPGARAQVAPSEREVSLAELLAFAERNAPTAQLAVPRRRLGDAARADADPWLRQNPTIALGIGPRFAGTGERELDFFASLGQPVELAGERGLRLAAAARLEERLEAETSAAVWDTRLEVTLAYRSAALAGEWIAISDELLSFSEEMLTLAHRRLGAGDATAVEVRVAEIEVAHARQAKLSAELELRAARLRLADATGWSLEAPPNVRRGLETPRAVPTLEAVMQAAAGHHPELRARRATIAEAHARVELADREAWPAPVLGVQVAREGAAGGLSDYVLLGTLQLALPFSQRNQGERARTRVDEELARVQESATSRALRSRIARAHAELTSAFERITLFASSMSPSLEDSLALLRRGVDAGELPLLTVAVARQRFIEAQRDAPDAYADYYRASAELEYAMGVAMSSVAAPVAGGAR